VNHRLSNSAYRHGAVVVVRIQHVPEKNTYVGVTTPRAII